MYKPSYYGSRGVFEINNFLVDKLLKTNILTIEKTDPLKPNVYINQVLAPEIAIMLISQDRENISFKEARSIMKDSLEFGMYLHDIDNVNDKCLYLEYHGTIHNQLIKY